MRNHWNVSACQQSVCLLILSHISISAVKSFFKKSVPSPNFFPLPSSPPPIHHGNILISSYFLIDQSWDPLDAAPSGQSPDGGLGDALYVVPQHLPVPLGSTLTQPLPSLAPPVPTHGLDLDRTPIDLFSQRNAVIKFRECLVPVEYIYISVMFVLWLRYGVQL